MISGLVVDSGPDSLAPRTVQMLAAHSLSRAYFPLQSIHSIPSSNPAPLPSLKTDHCDLHKILATRQCNSISMKSTHSFRTASVYGLPFPLHSACEMSSNRTCPSTTTWLRGSRLPLPRGKDIPSSGVGSASSASGNRRLWNNKVFYTEGQPFAKSTFRIPPIRTHSVQEKHLSRTRRASSALTPVSGFLISCREAWRLSKKWGGD